jgi:flagella basal body P-ring formation protein FlgA
MRNASIVIGVLFLCTTAVAFGQSAPFVPQPTDEAARRLACVTAEQHVTSNAAKAGFRALVECLVSVSRVSGLADAELAPAAGPQVSRSGTHQVTLRAVASNGQHVNFAVPVAVRLFSNAWIAQRSVAVSEVVRANDTVWQEVEWPAGSNPTTATQPQPMGRTKRAIRKGEAVDLRSIVEGQEVLRGDRVVVVYQAGAVQMQTTANLVADGRVGSRARAQIKDRSVVVEGMLVTGSTLLLEEK